MRNMSVVLVPVDGSGTSMHTVDYLCRMLSPSNAGIELFHVLTEKPEPFLDLGETDDAVNTYEREIGQWNSTRRGMIDQFMQRARNRFLDAGFPSDHLSIVLQPCKVGITRDIIAKAESGCAAVVIGRKSSGDLPDFMLGGIAAKLVEAIVQVPLAVVGGQPECRRVVVGIDRSAFIRKGLSAVSSLLSTDLEKIELCRIVRPLTESHPDKPAFPSARDEDLWLEANKCKILPSLTNAEQRLLRAGFSPEILHSTVIGGKASRADGLYAETRHIGAGTILVGRRGTTLVEDFTMGRVTRKILHLAYDKAVWIA